MSDKSSAAIFGMVFTELARNPDERAKEMALVFWDETGDYDFSEEQLCCDDELIKLGLAKKGIRAKYPEDGEVTLYKSLHKPDEYI